MRFSFFILCHFFLQDVDGGDVSEKEIRLTVDQETNEAKYEQAQIKPSQVWYTDSSGFIFQKLYFQKRDTKKLVTFSGKIETFSGNLVPPTGSGKITHEFSVKIFIKSN